MGLPYTNNCPNQQKFNIKKYKHLCRLLIINLVTINTKNLMK